MHAQEGRVVERERTSGEARQFLSGWKWRRLVVGEVEGEVEHDRDWGREEVVGWSLRREQRPFDASWTLGGGLLRPRARGKGSGPR